MLCQVILAGILLKLKITHTYTLQSGTIFLRKIWYHWIVFLVIRIVSVKSLVLRHGLQFDFRSSLAFSMIMFGRRKYRTIKLFELLFMILINVTISWSSYLRHWPHFQQGKVIIQFSIKTKKYIIAIFLFIYLGALVGRRRTKMAFFTKIFSRDFPVSQIPGRLILSASVILVVIDIWFSRKKYILFVHLTHPKFVDKKN